MQPKIKTWKVEETELAYTITEFDERFTFTVPRKFLKNYMIDYDPEFSEEFHYFDLLSGQVLCFSEVDLMITDPKNLDENGSPIIIELSTVLDEAFKLIREVPTEDKRNRHFRDRQNDLSYNLSLFENLGFRPAKDFKRIIKGVV